MSLISSIKELLTPDLLKGRWQQQTSMLSGHCYVASEALWHLLDNREEWKPMVYSYLDEQGKSSHWWLKHKVTGDILDVTKEQFSYNFPYHLGKGCGFLTKLPSKRAQKVIDSIQKSAKVEI